MAEAPYLGRQPGWLRRQRKPLVLLGLTLVAYLTAINRGQAFPWATAALLSATLLTGFTAPHWLIRNLSVTRRGPGRAEEGETIHFQVEVRNAGWLPRFMVELVDRLPFVAAAEQHRIGPQAIGLLAYLPGRRSSRFTIPIHCAKRGHYRLGPVGLSSRFPLGLAEAKQHRNDGVQTLTVYPDIFNIIAMPLRGAPSQIHRGGYLLPEGAGAAEFSGLREYRRGDNPRHIHWPSSARLNELIVREYEPLASACLTLVLDRSATDNLGQGKETTFEYAVRIAGSIARYACQQNIRTRLVGHGETSAPAAFASGENHYGEILDHLATVEADGGSAYGEFLLETGSQCRRGETLVVFLNDENLQDAPLRQALATLHASQLHIFAIVFAAAGFREGNGTAGNPAAGASLAEQGAQVVSIRQGDDLLRVFNP